ncbi:MAG TPA: hypothetical protein HPP87_07190 [Planctomycetes bacterium]|nr:hypothetical protein [Planctomycetota bacterium]
MANKLTLRLNQLTPLYNDLDIAYSQAMSGPYEDVSYRGDDCEVVAGLKDGRITGFWRPMVAVGDDKSLKLHIERLYDISRDIYYMDFLANGKVSVVSEFLLRRGYRARPVYFQVIDLERSMGELHAGIRKSYKSLVTKTGNIDYGQIEDYVLPHSMHGGRERPDPTWKIQQGMIDRSEAFCLTDGPDAAVLIYCKDAAYYAGGRSGKQNTHALLWQGIVRSQIRGAKTFEVGEIAFHSGHTMSDGARADSKYVNISAFKRGFGGKTVTRLILEMQT